MSARELSTPAERAEFQRKFPRAVWDDDAQGFTESMYTYAMVGWLAARRADLEIPRPDTGSHLDSEDAARYRWLRSVYGQRYRIIPGPVYAAEHVAAK